MANIKKLKNSYRIRVYCGYDMNHKQIIQSMNWKPSPGMTERQIEKELQRQAVLFEEKCQTGQFMSSNIRFADFIDTWFEDYAKQHLKDKTQSNYQVLLQRIIPALGHIKITKLQPHHLLAFYKNIAEEGIRHDTRYKPHPNFKSILKKEKVTQQSLADMTGLSVHTIYACSRGDSVSENTVNVISNALHRADLFTPIDGDATLSSKTISEHHRLLSSILTTAVQWQVIPSNPCDRVKPPKVEHKEAVALDEVQAQELISALNSEPLFYKTAIMLLLYTGMRRGELCGLEWSDIDMTNGIIHIDKALLYISGKGVFEDSTKTKSSVRVVNIPNDMIMLLKQHRIEQQKKRLLIGDQWKNTNKVFTAADGSFYRPDSLTSWFSKFIKRHKLPDAHIHTLRHTSATLLIAGGVDIATVSKRLGHANRTTTLNIYTHAIKSADAVAAEKLNNIFNPTEHYRAQQQG